MCIVQMSPWVLHKVHMGPAQGPCTTTHFRVLHKGPALLKTKCFSHCSCRALLQDPCAGPSAGPALMYMYIGIWIYKYNYFTTACGRTQPVPPVVSLKHEKACGRLLCHRLLEPRGLNSVQHSSWHKLFGIFALANFEKDVCFIMLMRPVQGYQSAQPMEVPQCRM